jgi:hypothetical protein
MKYNAQHLIGNSGADSCIFNICNSIGHLCKCWADVFQIPHHRQYVTVGQKAPFGRLLPNVPAAPPSVGEGLPSVALRPTDGFAKSQKKSSASPTFFPGLRKAAGTLSVRLKNDRVKKINKIKNERRN